SGRGRRALPPHRRPDGARPAVGAADDRRPARPGARPPAGLSHMADPDLVYQRTRRSPQLSPLGGLLAVTAVGFVWFWSSASIRPSLLLALGLVWAVVIAAVWGCSALPPPDLRVSCPVTATVGEPLEVRVQVDGIRRPARLTMLSMPGSPGAMVEPGQPGLL